MFLLFLYCFLFLLLLHVARTGRDLQFVGLSWYAQEFVETLERTVDADEVLFVCAFAIYQNEVRSAK